MKSDQNLIWLDMEMTGLDFATDAIMSMAFVVTTPDLVKLDDGIELILHVSNHDLASMGDWCTKQHGSSGLTEACRKSTLTPEKAVTMVLSYLNRYAEPGKSPMCGNSIHFDREFLRRHFRTIHDFFHYRNFDVSTIRKMLELWAEVPKFEKTYEHTALSDISQSIDEARYYRRALGL